MSERMTRRELLRQTTLATGIAALGGVWTEGQARPSRSPNEKLNLAQIGVGGQGGSDLSQFRAENIVALCDVDDERGAEAFKAHPNAKKYKDFRKMLDEMHKSIDAVVVSTPDHVHGPAAAMALHLRKHVYCQKPLTHSVYEARTLAKLAAEAKVATQMGTQGHAFAGNIKAVEILQGGGIGTVKEVHVWSDRPKGWWPQGVVRPQETQPVPATLDWDLWLGPAAARPFHSSYLPFVWRGWWDFGTGSLGDMACHLMDVAFWALKLPAPVSVEAKGEGMTADSPPVSAVIHYNFPARGDLSAITLHWYDGGNRPSAELFQGEDVPNIDNGSLYIGEKGMLLLDHGREPLLLPLQKYAGYQAPAPTIRRPQDHYQEWAQACKMGSPTGSHFGYAGPMTEAILLGNIALRLNTKIEWDAKRMKVKGHPEADALLRPAFRKGWKL